MVEFKNLIYFFLLCFLFCGQDLNNPNDPYSEEFFEFNLLRCLAESPPCIGGGASDFLAPEPQTIVFQENWESGLDPAKWKSWGTPLPAINNGGGFGGGNAIDTEGDGSYESGVTTYQNFDLNRPTVLEFKALGTSSELNWQLLWVGFSRETAASYTGTTTQPPVAWSIRVQPETSKYNIIYFFESINNSNEPWLPDYDGTWHEYKIYFDATGIVRYYRDGELKHTSSFAITGQTSQPVAIHGRSFNTTILVDDLVVRQ